MMNKHFNAILSFLEKCRTMNDLKQLHALMVTTRVIKSIIPLSRLIDFAANSKSGDLEYARSVFDQIDRPSVYIWNSMIKAYSSTEDPYEALSLYIEMHQCGSSPDNFTFPFVLKSCSIIRNANCGKCIHDRIVKTGFDVDVYASTALLHMYVSCADMEAGLKVFDNIPKSNVVAWTCLINGFLSNERASDSIRVFKDMENWNVEPNEVTWVNVLVACARTRDIDTGRWVHSRIRDFGLDPFTSSADFNVILASAVVEMYAKCGSLKVARRLFDKMLHRNIVAWNSMVSAYDQYGWTNEALHLFSDMRIAGFVPDKATFLSVISVCAQLGALELGQGLHASISKKNIGEDIAIGTALVNMYAKAGDAKSAKQVFLKLQKKDTMAWTSMLIGLAKHGHGNEALCTFREMQEHTSAVPDQVTYIGVLCACSHVGLVEEGWRHFISMRNVYGIVPTIEHYGCMVDLLSRAGRFEEAEMMVENMPIQPNINVWSSLLNGCEIHENINLADQVRSYIVELEAHGSGVYVLLSNIYARAGKWEEANLARELMKNRTIRKSIGHSKVEMKLLYS